MFSYQTVLLVIACVVYLYKPRYVVFFWLLLTPLAILVLSWCLGISSRDDLAELRYNVMGMTGPFFCVLILIAMYKRKSKPHIKTFISVFIVFSAYLFFHSFITVFCPQTIYYDVRTILSLVFPLIFLMMDEEAVPQKKDVKLFVAIFLGIEFVAVLLNTQGIYLYKASYAAAISDYFQKLYDYENSLVSGTFPRYNMLANYVSTLYVFFILECLNDKANKWFFVAGITMLLIILLSGAKISLVLVGVTSALAILCYWKKNIGVLVMFVVISAAFVNFLLEYNYNVDVQVNEFEGVNRQIKGLASFLQGEKDGATTSISMYLLEKYFFDSPFWGNGLSPNGEYAYGSYYGIGLQLIKADARLAFMLVEYGIIGIFWYVAIFWSIYKILSRNLMKNGRVKLKICFLYYLLLTITEGGFFDSICFPMLYVYVFSFLRIDDKRCGQEQSVQIMNMEMTCQNRLG